ncbi:MAG: translation initiation factor IF-2 [Bacteroidota bacterium]
MAKRLIKIAKELNVGTSTIVDHLNKNGYDIDNKPTAKVTDEMYTELLKEFQKSIAIKEKADQLVIGNRIAVKKEKEAEAAEVSEPLFPPPPPTPPAPKATVPPPPPPPVVETAPVEETPAAPVAEVTPPAEPVAVEKVETPVVESPPATEIPQPKAKVVEEKPAEEVAPAKEPDSPKIGLNIKGKIDLDNIGKPKKEAQSPQKEPEKPATKAVESSAPVAKEEKVINKAPKEEVRKEVPANPPAEVVNKQTTPQTPPAQEGTKEEKGEKQESSSGDSNELVRAKTPQLKGLKILGKIDTDKLKRPKKKKKKKGEAAPDSNASGSNTSKEGDSTQKSSGSSTGGDAPKKRRRTRKRVAVTVRPGGRSGDGRRTRNNRRDEVKEVSQKEIEEKIKQTMARLSGGGKKKRQRIRRDNRERLREKQEMIEQAKDTGTLQLTEFVSVSELASLMDVPVTSVITTCMNLGVIVSINQRLDAEIIELVASEYNHEVEFISAEDQLEEEEEIIDDPEDLSPRAPIVTVMGHVDHGKTSLLDYIRSANVTDGEAGGITQHIGAYEVEVGEDNKKITFLDTPGHEAFTAMRARGAKVTDIAIIIISADDNVMPQTKEAISHAQAAGVPMVFAINKIDKEGADPNRIKQELANMNLLIEEWGGKYQSQDISAKTGDNIDLLLEKVLLEAEMLELQANPDRQAIGTVIEASLDRGRGYVTKILVQNGALSIGDAVVAGEYSGKIKAMFNERGSKVKLAGPSTAVLILGLSGAPQAGEKFKVMDTEQEARQLASKRAQISREQATRASKRISLDEIGRRLALGTFKELNLIVKGDVDGSIEALADSLIKLSIETVQVNVIHKAVGQIIESDVLLASASDAIIIGFQVRPSINARKLAEREGVQIKTYSIIYEAIEEIKMAIEGMLEPTKEEKIVGQVEVREVYKISKVGTVAGSYVVEGKIAKSSHVRLVRNGIVIYPTKEGAHGEISSLKRFKEDAKEVKKNTECGITIKNFNDIKVGDVIEAYEIIEVKQTYNG